MSSLDLDRNFEITRRLFGLIGQHIFDPDFRPNWRTVYTGSSILLAMVQILYLLWAERSDLLKFLVILPNLMFATQGMHKMIMTTKESGKILSLRIKLTEIETMLDDLDGNGSIIWKVLQMSHVVQKLIVLLYMASVVLVILMPFILWLMLDKKILMFVFFIPEVDERTSEGFLLHMVLHALMMPAAFCGYTGHECMFLAFIMPIWAYVDAFANEVKKLNSMLDLPKRDDSAIRDQLNRIIKLHQLLNEYEILLEDLYNFLILTKLGLIYVGIISTIVVILKSNDRMAIIFFVLMVVQLTQSCLMGTIITVKNEQLLGHICDIHWYQLLSQDQTKNVALMLHRAQYPASVTIGSLKPLNVESYMSVLNSIYSYVMVLVTFLE